MQWIKDIVTGLIETYGTRDIYELLRCLEVEVIPKKFKNPDAKARLIKDPLDQYYYIYISNDLDESMKRFILCHELGHILLHGLSCEYYYVSKVNKGKLEYQANYFASLLLVEINGDNLCYLENLSIDQLSSYFKIPKDLLQYTIKKMI